MYLDKLNMFSEDQAITASAASTNYIDLGSATGDLGNSSRGEIYCTTTAAFNNLTSLAFKVQTSVDAAFSSPIDLPAQETVLLAGLGANKEVFKTSIPYGCKRYIRLYYTVAGTAPTTGKITAGIIIDRQTNV